MAENNIIDITPVVQPGQEKTSLIQVPKAKLVDIAKINDIGAALEGWNAVVDMEDSRVFNIVTPKYHIIQHDEIIHRIHGALDKLGIEYKEKLLSYNDGARIHMDYSFPGIEEPITPKVGDVVRFKLFADNSYDGSTGFRVIYGGERLICTNGMVSMDREGGYYHRHTKGVELDEISRLVEDGIHFYRDQFVERFKRYEEVPMLPAAMIEQIGEWKEEKIIPLKHLEKAEAWVHAGVSIEGQVEHKSQYDFYNVMTAVITHNVESIDARIQYGQKIDRQFEDMRIAA